MRTAQYITGAKLPAIQDLYTRRCQRKALKMVNDPSYRLFSLLPHGKRYRSAKSRTKRLQQFLPPSHKTPEQVIKWLPGLFALCAPPAAATLCLSYMHSHFNYTFMYILPQLGRPTSAPTHWLTGLSALCPTHHHLPTPLLRHCYSLFIYAVTLTISTYYLNQPD